VVISALAPLRCTKDRVERGEKKELTKKAVRGNEVARFLGRGTYKGEKLAERGGLGVSAWNLTPHNNRGKEIEESEGALFESRGCKRGHS